jgi:hypothetical protein
MGLPLTCSWKSLSGIISFVRDVDWGNPEKGSIPMSRGSFGRIPNQGPWNTVKGEIPTQGMSSNFRNQPEMQSQMKTPFTR